MADSVFSDIPASSGKLVFGAEGDSLPPASQLIFEDRPAVYGNLVFGTENDGVILDAPLSVSGRIGDLAGSIRVTAKPPPRLLANGSIGELGGSVRLTARPPDARLSVSGVIGHLSGGGIIDARAPVPEFSFQVIGLIGELTGESRVLYSSNTERPDVLGLHSTFSQGTAVGAATAAPYRAGLAMPAPLRSVWRNAVSLRESTSSSWQEGLRHQVPAASSYEEAVRVSASSAGAFRNGERLQRWIRALYEEAAFVSGQRTSSFQEAYRDRVNATVSWYQEALRLALQRESLFAAGLALRQRHASAYQEAMRPLGGDRYRPQPVIPPGACYVPSAALVFAEEWSAHPEMVFICERHATPPPAALVVVPTLRTYVTVNSITLRRVDGDIPIPAYAFSMSLDWQSWTWSWSATIELASLPLITPGGDGMPVEVEAVVNGVPYRLCCEGVGSQRQFANGRVSIKGRGLAAVLDAPYAAVLNYASLSARTAQQLMLDALTVNGVSIGWEVDWGLTDWLVPGNTWSHQGAYISAVTTIAQAAGGYVQPHDTDKTLRILPGYPAAPWAWAGVVPDFELPSAVVEVEGIEWLRKPGYNRVYVSGMSGGVLGQVTRAGTAGDSVAPMITDALITHADAARQRGIAVLADTGSQARVNLTLPVLAETGLIKPGKFVRYTDAGVARMGLVRSTALNWSRPKMRQSLSIETHV